MTEMHHYVHQE